MKRLRGLKSLVGDAVEHGSRAIERVQIETAKMPFDLVERIPGLEVPAGGVRLLYNTGVSTTHGMIRLVNKVVGDTLDVVLDAVERRATSEQPSRAAAAEPASPGAPEQRE
jgi:hypothetical protein